MPSFFQRIMHLSVSYGPILLVVVVASLDPLLSSAVSPFSYDEGEKRQGRGLSHYKS